MPKEITYGDSPAFMVKPDGSEQATDDPTRCGTGPVQRRGAVVGWSRQQYVEIGVAAFEVSTQAMTTGQFASFDRDGCNRLIRVDGQMSSCEPPRGLALDHGRSSRAWLAPLQLVLGHP